MEDITKRPQPEMEVSDLRQRGEDPRSCFDCKHIRGRNGWPYCKYFDKPTSGSVNWCFGYEPR